MIYDHRTYTCRPGTIAKHLKLYEAEGWQIQKNIWVIRPFMRQLKRVMSIPMSTSGNTKVPPIARRNAPS